MEQANYHTSFTIPASPAAALQHIANVGGWWAKNFTGHAAATGDTFIVRFGGTSVDFEISEFIPDRKIVWKVNDCNLNWLKNKKEWLGTTVVWDLSTTNGQTKVDMTHVGVAPGVECYESCVKGWNEHIYTSLVKMMEGGEGIPA